MHHNTISVSPIITILQILVNLEDLSKIQQSDL